LQGLTNYSGWIISKGIEQKHEARSAKLEFVLLASLV